MTEETFLKKLFTHLPPQSKELLIGPGDDAAVYIPKENWQQVVSCDQLIEGRHYLPDTDPQLCGRKLLARNISDIAAMGAIPKYALISCNLSPSCSEDYLLQFHLGLLSLAREYDMQIIGGDLATGATANAFSLTIIGETQKAISRHNAQDSELLFATGAFGKSFPTEHHLTFQPRLVEARFLADYASAMIDVTDGLLLDARRMLKQLNLIINTEAIPRREGATLEQALCDGEDYELLFAIPAKLEEQLTKNWPFSTPLTKIGEFKKGTGKIFDHKHIPLDNLINKGFDHF